MATQSQLNPAEKFVIDALVAEFGADWKIGPNPPDAYLLFDTKTVAVEITTVTQYVTDGGGTRPRASDDSVLNPMINHLNAQLQEKLIGGYSIGLIISAPVSDVRKTTQRLVSILTTMLDDIVSCPEETIVNIRGNEIKICIHSREGRPFHDVSSVSKIWGVCQNRSSSPNILANAIQILEERITTKRSKCAGITGIPVWLALLNDYWLADNETYDRAFAAIDVEHPFEKILLVRSDSSIHRLFGR